MSRRTYDVQNVGAAFAAMYLLNRLRGMGFSMRVLKAGRGLGRFPAYLRKIDEVAAKGYEGFAFAKRKEEGK